MSTLTPNGNGMSSHPKLDALTDSATIKLLSGVVRVLTFAAGLGALGGLYELGLSLGKLTERSDVATANISELVQGQKDLHTALTQEHTDAAAAAALAASAAASAASAAAQTAKDLAEGRAVNLPRLGKLEDAISIITPALARIEQKADDNLRVSNSHTPALNAVRNAVVPGEDHSRGQ